MSFHINCNKRHKEIRTCIKLYYHETQTRCNHSSYSLTLVGSVEFDLNRFCFALHAWADKSCVVQKIAK